MENIFCYENNTHRYTLAATGIKFKTHEFTNRPEALRFMYHYLNKKNIRIAEIYDDKHYKTYICNDGIRFYINRI